MVNDPRSASSRSFGILLTDVRDVCIMEAVVNLQTVGTDTPNADLKSTKITLSTIHQSSSTSSTKNSLEIGKTINNETNSFDSRTISSTLTVLTSVIVIKNKQHHNDNNNCYCSTTSKLRMDSITTKRKGCLKPTLLSFCDPDLIMCTKK
jgi:hypothetical protein